VGAYPSRLGSGSDGGERDGVYVGNMSNLPNDFINKNTRYSMTRIVVIKQAMRFDKEKVNNIFIYEL